MKYPLSLPKHDIATWNFKDVNFGYTNSDVNFYDHRDIVVLGMHTHEFYEINIVLKGRGRHYIENRSWEAKKGSVFVIPPGFSHGYMSHTSMDIYHILLSETFMAKYAPSLEHIDGYSILFEIEPMLRSSTNKGIFLNLSLEKLTFLEKLLSANDKESVSDEFKVYVVLAAISFLCGEIKIEKKYNPAIESPDFTEIINSMEYIRRNCSKKINFEKLAKKYNFSYSVFLKKFTQTALEKPSSYQNRQRAAKAAGLLRYGSDTLLSIALECGFYDSPHFIRTFKKYYTISPSQFRKANRNTEP